MKTLTELEQQLNSHPLVTPRLKTLALAEQINPNFKNPHIVGGFLRNVALGLPPKDCDVIFQGNQLNQPGIAEAVLEAEAQLGVHYPEWEFENISATGLSGDFFEDSIGKHSYHTDYLTLMLMDAKGNLIVGDDKALIDLNDKRYELRLSGVEVWANHRGNGRSYASCLLGDLIRALYLCHDLQLTPSSHTNLLLLNFDTLFNQLDTADQDSRRKFWLKKTKNRQSFQIILDKYNIKSLTISS